MATKDVRMLSCSQEEIRSFLAQKVKTNGVKEYELLVSLMLCQFLEDECGKPCRIGFELKEKYWSEVQSGNVGLDDASTVFEEFVRQDSEVDIGIICEDMGGFTAFQLKRFDTSFQKDTSEAALAAYINEQKREYVGVRKPATLMLILRVDYLSFDEVCRRLDAVDFPFTRIMYVRVPNGEEKLRIGEFWPQEGYNEYEIVNGCLVKTND